MTTRKTAIEKLCRLFLSRQNIMIEECRDNYKHLLSPLMLTTDYLTATDIGELIESVGDELFSNRPANMTYVMVFLEFVLQIFETVHTVSVDTLITSAVNVLERTTFSPIKASPGLFSITASIFMNIFYLCIGFVLLIL